MTVPNANQAPVAKLSLFRSVLELTGRNHIRFAVKAGKDYHLLLSGKLVNTINSNTDSDYIEILIGGTGNSRSTIRVGILSGWAGEISTPGILDPLAFKYFWMSWINGVFKVGFGFEIDQNSFMERSYDPLVVDIKYLALCNGWETEGTWEVYKGSFVITFHSLYRRLGVAANH